MKQQNKPIFLDLTKIHFPIPAISSILHRISGFIVFLLIPLILWCARSATTVSGFTTIQIYLTNPFFKFLIWVVFAALLFHLVAGIRHLFMDMHVGESLRAGKMTAWATIIISIILMIIAGVWLW